MKTNKRARRVKKMKDVPKKHSMASIKMLTKWNNTFKLKLQRGITDSKRFALVNSYIFKKATYSLVGRLLFWCSFFFVDCIVFIVVTIMLTIVTTILTMPTIVSTDIICTFRQIFHEYHLQKILEVLRMYSFRQKANRYRFGNASKLYSNKKNEIIQSKNKK